MTLPTTVSAGSYDPTRIGTSTIVTFTVTYECDLGPVAANLMITAGLGTHGGGSFATRRMSAGGVDRLNYWLYPPGFAVTPHSSVNVWGDGSAASKVWGPFLVVGGGAAASGTASLQVAGNQDVAGGSYTDPVVFTMTFL